jgi:hypothetical protein
MTRYLLITDFQPGVAGTPIEGWKPGELVQSEILTGPDLAKVVTSDGGTIHVLDGPFGEFKEWIAGYQIVDVESEARAIEIAARLSAVPGENGVPIQQPITIRQVMDDAPSNAAEMGAFLEHVGGAI